jgi:3-oxoacyl-(acyl-carrier-protein) synthase
VRDDATDARMADLQQAMSLRILVLESLDHAKSHGATPLAEVVGYGSSADSFRITDIQPEGKGAMAFSIFEEHPPFTQDPIAAEFVKAFRERATRANSPYPYVDTQAAPTPGP